MDLLKLASMATLLQYEKGEIIQSPADSTHEYLYGVIKGDATEYENYNQDNQLEVSQLKFGDIFGEVSFFAGLSRTTTIVANEDTALVAINSDNFNSICENYPEDIFDMFSILSKKMYTTSKKADKYKKMAEDAVGKEKVSQIELESSNQKLFPPQHKPINLTEPNTYKDFVSPTEYTCPCCKKKFDSVIQLTSRLRPQKGEQLRGDLRQKYVDYDPLWYDITTCPNCLFSAQTSHFAKGTYVATADFMPQLAEVKSFINPTFTYPKTLEQVFTSYYLALICADGFEIPKQVRARLWLQLSWMYSDINQPEMTTIAQRKSFDFYSEFYSVTNLQPVSEQACCLVLGYLGGYIGEFELALKYLYNVKIAVDGKPIYKQVADREADIIRDAHRAAKKAKAENSN